MTPTEILAELDARGVTVEAHGDHLRYSPRDGVTPELVEQLRTQKTLLLKLLRSHQDSEPKILSYRLEVPRSDEIRVRQPSATIDDWPAWALQDTIGPDEFTESPAAARLRRRAAELRARRAKK